jgi:7,8-dihydroneopterin aldolase/epimerase/oxygenase
VLGWVELRGLRCWGRHGVYPDEQATERVFLVDVAVRTDVERAARSDDLSDALDLASLAQTVQDVFVGPSRKLLEALALATAAAVLQRFTQAVEVKVRVRKPDPPGIEAAEEAACVQVSK